MYARRSNYTGTRWRVQSYRAGSKPQLSNKVNQVGIGEFNDANLLPHQKATKHGTTKDGTQLLNENINRVVAANLDNRA